MNNPGQMKIGVNKTDAMSLVTMERPSSITHEKY